MTAQFEDLKGKTIFRITPIHGDGAPQVRIEFKDRTSYILSVQENVFFEGAMINHLRKAQPIVDVIESYLGGRDHVVELRARTFPQLQLLARNMTDQPHRSPFELVQL